VNLKQSYNWRYGSRALLTALAWLLLAGPALAQAGYGPATPASSFIDLLSKHQRVMKPVSELFLTQPVQVTYEETGAANGKTTLITWQDQLFRQEHTQLGFTEISAADGQDYWYGSHVNLPYSMDHARGLDISLQLALGFKYLAPEQAANLFPAPEIPAGLERDYHALLYAPPGMSQVLILLDLFDFRTAGVLQGNERQLSDSVQYTLVRYSGWRDYGVCWYPAEVTRVTLDSAGEEQRSRVMYTTAVDAVAPQPASWFSRSAAPPVAAPKLPKVPYEVPFSFLNDTVVIRCIGPDGQRMRFELDTGANVGLLRRDVARKLGLEPTGDEQVTGHGSSVSVGYVRVEGLMLEGEGRDHSVAIPAFPAAVLTDNNALDNSLSDHGVDGLIGNLILNNFVLKLDYRRRMVSLYPADSFTPGQYLGHGYHELPVERDSMPYVQVAVDSKITGGAFFNTGAQQFFTLNAWAIDAAGLHYPIDRIDTGVTIGGSQAFGVIHPGRVELGGIVLKSPPTTLEVLAPGEAPNPDRIASFGNAFFQRYTVTFDLFHNMYYIEGV
jgi:hypothetical protein